MSDCYFDVLSQELALGQHLMEAGFILGRAFHRMHHYGDPFLMYVDEDMLCGLHESPRIECESQSACCQCPWPIIVQNKQPLWWNLAPQGCKMSYVIVIKSGNCMNRHDSCLLYLQQLLLRVGPRPKKKGFKGLKYNYGTLCPLTDFDNAWIQWQP